MTDAPERIWFYPVMGQSYGGGSAFDRRLHQGDVEYVRADLLTAATARAEAAEAERDDAMSLFHASDKACRAAKAAAKTARVDALREAKAAFDQLLTQADMGDEWGEG